MARRLMLACCVALSCALGSAASRAQAPSDASLAAARELVVVMRSTDQIKLMLPSIMQALKPAIVQGRPDVQKDFDALVPILIDGMSARVNELVDQLAVVYAKNFTVDDMRDIANFYRSPVGQKLLDKLPAVMQESMSIGQSFGQKIAGEMQARLIDELRKRGHKI
jgi:uncharacterized protein